MALRMELVMPPAYMVLRELREDVHDLLFEHSSEQ